MPEIQTGLTPFISPRNRGALLLFLVVLGVAWLVLINNLRVVWSANAEYRYGWAVPVLCLALMVRKPTAGASQGATSGRHRSLAFGCLVTLALLYAPTRLIGEANPDWRVISWALALEVVGLTLALVCFVLGLEWLRRLAFPIAFFLVAVPWPTLLENDVIQGLTSADTATAVEVLDWLGVSALQHGNVIEVATGNVGVDDACSGIRSLQATLMISLFLGESYLLTFSRRLGLLLGGFALSFIFNLTRMCLLTWVAAHQGIAAIKVWHDQTGDTVLVACCLALWGLGVLLAKNQKRSASVTNPTASPSSIFNLQSSIFLPLTLLLWLVAVEVSVESWYRWHEAHLPPVQTWGVAWPTNALGFQTVAFSEPATEMLRYDAGENAAWKADGLQWQVIYLEWRPEHRALVYAKLHTPDVCITAAGNPTTRVGDWTWNGPDGLRLPFGVYTVANTLRPMHVFYCMWSDRSQELENEKMPRSVGARLAPVLAGVRNAGHRSLEVSIVGNLDEKQAEAAVSRELGKIIQSR